MMTQLNLTKMFSQASQVVQITESCLGHKRYSLQWHRFDWRKSSEAFADLSSQLLHGTLRPNGQQYNDIIVSKYSFHFSTRYSEALICFEKSKKDTYIKKKNW